MRYCCEGRDDFPKVESTPAKVAPHPRPPRLPLLVRERVPSPPSSSRAPLDVFPPLPLPLTSQFVWLIHHPFPVPVLAVLRSGRLFSLSQGLVAPMFLFVLDDVSRTFFRNGGDFKPPYLPFKKNASPPPCPRSALIFPVLLVILRLFVVRDFWQSQDGNSCVKISTPGSVWPVSDLERSHGSDSNFLISAIRTGGGNRGEKIFAPLFRTAPRLLLYDRAAKHCRRRLAFPLL